MLVFFFRPLSAPVLGSMNSESRIGDERPLSLGQKFACCVPLFCMRSTSLFGGGPPARSVRANGRNDDVTELAARACSRERRLNDMRDILVARGYGASTWRW